MQGETRVFVNPAEYLFEEYLHYGYVIAAAMPDVEELKKIKFPDYVTRSINNFISIFLDYCFPNVMPRSM